MVSIMSKIKNYGCFSFKGKIYQTDFMEEDVKVLLSQEVLDTKKNDILEFLIFRFLTNYDHDTFKEVLMRLNSI